MVTIRGIEYYMNLKNFVKKMLFGYKASSESYVHFLKRKGVDVGVFIEISFPRITFIDFLNPHLLTIGSNVSMTGPTTILTHDYSVCVLKKWKKGEILGKQRKTVIGNNIFLGWGCTILPGTEIGDNVIIGANAVVSGKVESESVYAGNPAKRICSLEEYYIKRKNNQYKEALDIFEEYVRRFGQIPPQAIFHEYYFLFSTGNDNKLIPSFRRKLYDHGNYAESKNFLLHNKPMFKSYDEFVNVAISDLGIKS